MEMRVKSMFGRKRKMEKNFGVMYHNKFLDVGIR